MDSVRDLIVGAGITGLATAAFLRDKDYLVLEADSAIGGYCKSVKKDGFTWDYSGHFFHFKHPDIEAWLRERMKGQQIHKIERRSFISYKGRLIDFPFQKNIHQLPQDEFIECLVDLYMARSSDVARDKAAPETNFNEMLYACDLAALDKDSMGRFFPHADLTDIVRNMRTPDNAGYNATFTYPEGGAIEYVKALASEVRPDAITLGEKLVGLDLQKRVAKTNRREIRFQRMVSSAPFNRLAQMAGLPHDPSVWSW